MYVGDYHQNKKHGKGTFYWFTLSEPAGTKEESPKVEQYEGMWWGGLPDGEGQYEKSNGKFKYIQETFTWGTSRMVSNMDKESSTTPTVISIVDNS